MAPQWFQIRLSSTGRKPLFMEEDTLRRCVRALARITSPDLLLFGLADDHGHFTLRTTRARAADVARALHNSLHRTTGLDLEPAWIDEVRSRSHLLNLLPYDLRQSEHHRLPRQDALWTGSCVHEMVGTRWIRGFSLCFFDEIPRSRPEDALAALGLGRHPLGTPAMEELSGIPLPNLLAATSAAACVPGALQGNEPSVVEARVAAIHLAIEAGYGRVQIADALGCTRQGVGRLANHTPEGPLLAAVRRRLALEARVASHGAGSTPAEPFPALPRP